VRILFIHQNMPAQFKHLAPALAREGHEVLFLTQREDRELPGVRRFTYRKPANKISTTHGYIRRFEEAVWTGQQVARACLQLKRRGLEPDLVIAHPGWGESLFVKDVFPTTSIISFCEFYYRGSGSDVGFDPEFPTSLDDVARARARNAHLLLALEAADAGLSPTLWQRNQHPRDSHSKISVIFDGIDTDVVKPRPGAAFQLPNGRVLTSGDEVVTFVARNLEPYRGYHNFIRALPRLLSERPKASVIVVGGDDVSYGRRAPNGLSWREHLGSGIEYDVSRVHHLGYVPYREYLNLLSISSLHVYLTVPFVLSWSFFEALSSGCLVLASDSPPVREVLVSAENGLLCNFFSPDDISEKASIALKERDNFQNIRANARDTIVQNYSLKQCLPQQIGLVNRFF